MQHINIYLEVFIQMHAKSIRNICSGEEFEYTTCFCSLVAQLITEDYSGLGFTL